MHAPHMEINADALEAAALERRSRVEESESDKRDRKRVGLKVLLEASFARTSNSPFHANRCGGEGSAHVGRKEGRKSSLRRGVAQAKRPWTATHGPGLPSKERQEKPPMRALSAYYTEAISAWAAILRWHGQDARRGPFPKSACKTLCPPLVGDRAGRKHTRPATRVANSPPGWPSGQV